MYKNNAEIIQSHIIPLAYSTQQITIKSEYKKHMK